MSVYLIVRFSLKGKKKKGARRRGEFYLRGSAVIQVQSLDERPEAVLTSLQ